MAINKLTDTEVRNAKPDSKEYTKGDGGGLALKISPNGSKTWMRKAQKQLEQKKIAATVTKKMLTTVSGVTELVVRASYAGSAAEIVATVPTTLTMEVGTAAADGSLSYTKVWSSAVGVGTFSLDGLVVSVASAVDVSTIKLTATSDGVYSLTVDGSTVSAYCDMTSDGGGNNVARKCRPCASCCVVHDLDAASIASHAQRRHCQAVARRRSERPSFGRRWRGGPPPPRGLPQTRRWLPLSAGMQRAPPMDGDREHV